MIFIPQTGSTTVILELFSAVTGSTPIYLFEVTNQTGVVKSFIASDISTSVCRYQNFTIENTSNENLLTGKINLLPGEYDYTIYQVQTLSLTGNKLVKLQTGVFIVDGGIDLDEPSNIYN